MERCLSSCWKIGDLTDKRDVFGFKGIPTSTKQVQCLTVHKENGFLRFMNDQLGRRIEIFTGVLPYEGAVITFVFDDLRDWQFYSPPLAS